MAGTGLDQKSFHLSYLGFAAVVATLPVYEPALHSFHTIAPVLFDRAATTFSPAAFAAMLTCSLAVLAAHAACRRNPSGPAARLAAAFDPGALPCKVAMAVCGLVGAAGLCLAARTVLPAAAVAALGACAGAGATLVLLAWGQLFLACTKKAALAHLAATSILGAFLLNTVGTLPYPVAVGLFMALEAVALAVPLLELRPAPAGHLPNAPASSCSPADAVRAPEARRRAPLAVHLAEPLLGIALFALSFQVLGAHTVYLFYLSFLLGTLVAGIAVLPVLFLNGRRPVMALLYEIVLPLAGFAVVAATVAVPDALQALTTRNGFMAFFSFAILLFLSSTVAFANAGEYHPQRVFAAATAFFAGASLVGLGVGTVASESACNDGFTVLVLAYLVFLALRPNVAAWRESQAPADGAPQVASKTDAADKTAPDDAALARVARRWGLTGREAEVLPLLVQGRTSTYIARTLYISDSTARGHAHKIYQKAGVSTKEELLAALADDQELLEPQGDGTAQ